MSDFRFKKTQEVSVTGWRGRNHAKAKVMRDCTKDESTCLVLFDGAESGEWIPVTNIDGYKAGDAVTYHCFQCPESKCRGRGHIKPQCCVFSKSSTGKWLTEKQIMPPHQAEDESKPCRCYIDEDGVMVAPMDENTDELCQHLNGIYVPMDALVKRTEEDGDATE